MSKRAMLLLVVMLAVSTLIVVAISSGQTSSSIMAQWQRYLPGVSGVSVIQTSDGGYLALGRNASIDDVSGEFTNYTSIAVKTDGSDNPVWAKTYSVAAGITETRLVYAVETSGGCVFAGTLAPAAYGFPEQFCLIKVDFDGNVVWNKTFSREVWDETYEVGGFISTSDGGYALVGFLSSPQPSIAYLWFVKVDSAGNLQWTKALLINSNLSPSPYMPAWLGGRASSLFQTNDGGYVIIGTSASRAISPSYAEIVKIDSDGNVQWYKTYGGEDDYYHTIIFSAVASTDEGYIMAGSAAPSGEAEKGIVCKVDSEGNMEWNKTYKYPGTIYSISRADDGGFVFVGMAAETLLDTAGGRYIWAWQIDSLGNIQLQSAIKKVDSYFFTNPASLIQSGDGGYVFTGVSFGPSNQASQLTAGDKFWIMKISKSEVTVTPHPDSNLFLMLWVLGGIVIVVILGVGLFVYFKKRKR
jgi:hypothetical protein